jgi:hypothetical protein
LEGAVTTKYWPCPIDELPDRRSLISEPLPPPNVITLRKTRSLHAMLCQTLVDTQSLLMRLEGGVQVQHNGQREVVRALYVASRNQAKALIATLELDGLE